MFLNELTAISPIDGRYRNKTNSLANYFSEYALIRYRVFVEVRYLLALANEIPALFELQHHAESIQNIAIDFSLSDAEKIKATEKITNHDVKAVEYFVKEKLDALNLSAFKEFVHFGLTSQDINNTAIPLSIKDFFTQELFVAIGKTILQIEALANEWMHISMLAHTHGQPASPTKLGKEMQVFAERLNKQLAELKRIPHAAKFGGATGNFNAHAVAYPQHDWIKFANHFVNEDLKLQRSIRTTQIEHYDFLAAQLDALKRINNILIDLCRDFWTYISMEYFKQKVSKNEVGSSAMPHKVNPIDFENAEGNLGVANALLEHLAAKLPISRLQRDLTDSTVLRNIGVPFAHVMISLSSIEKGLSKLLLNKEKIDADLAANWAVVAEAIQTILRRENYPNPYEKLKELTRGNHAITQEKIHAFIQTLEVNESVKNELLAVTPFNYTGV
jgi:adenylosuccinate lyase